MHLLHSLAELTLISAADVFRACSLQPWAYREQKVTLRAGSYFLDRVTIRYTLGSLDLTDDAQAHKLHIQQTTAVTVTSGDIYSIRRKGRGTMAGRDEMGPSDETRRVALPGCPPTHMSIPRARQCSAWGTVTKRVGTY